MKTRPSAKRFTGMDRQVQIYKAGLTGQRPVTPFSLTALEQKAKQELDPRAYDYVAGGAGGERTMRANLEAFERWRIVPRMLGDVSERDLSTELLGAKLAAPVLLGPVGVQSILHSDAEIATGRAAASLGVPFVLSTVSSRTLEDVATATANATRWFQLYPSKSAELNASLLRRAERAGYRAVVVTLDTRLLAWRERDLDNAYLPFFSGEGLGNYFSDPAFQAGLERSPQEDPAAAILHWAELFSNPASTWAELRAIRDEMRQLPLIVKGILHADDALHAIDCGADAVIVSNHGGRQLDGAIAALDALPGIVAAVNDRVPVLFDSGIRRGADVFKAVALGARAVLIGRLYCWGLAVNGEQGVREVVLNLLADFDLTLALSGYTCCRDLNASVLTAQL